LVSLPERPWELYDLSTDRIESHDISAEHPDLVKELSAEYEAWAKRVGVIPWETIAARRPEKPGRH
jgi:arylsulfatase